MNIRRKYALAGIILAGTFGFVPDSHGSDPTANSHLWLKANGYALTSEGLSRAFTEGNLEATSRVKHYVCQEETRHNFQELAPVIKKYLDKLPETYAVQGQRMKCMQILFAIDKKMTGAEKNAYMELLRTYLYDEKRKSKTRAVRAMESAARFSGVDISDDLILLCNSDVFHKMAGNMMRFPISLYLDLYGREAAPEEIEMMYEYWERDPRVQNYLVREAQKQGHLMDKSLKPLANHDPYMPLP